MTIRIGIIGYGSMGKMLLDKGYRIRIFNTINFAKSMRYNPFSYIHAEKDILRVLAFSARPVRIVYRISFLTCVSC